MKAGLRSAMKKFNISKPTKGKGKTPPKRSKANTEDFMNIEFDLKARGKTPDEREAIAKKMGFDKQGQKRARTKDVRGKLPKPPKPKTKAKAKAKTKPKPTPKRQVKGAKMVQGAGDKSDPGVGKFGAGQKQARGGATTQAKKAISDKEKDKLARDKAARGSFERAKGLKKGSLAQLQDDYSKLKAGDKRAERLKGTKSKYYPVFKKRGFKALKEGGPLKPVDKTKNPGLAKLPTKVRNNMGFAKKGGKVSYRKGGGQALVASLYD